MFVYPKKYDVVVIGAGHAGIEAALAAARMGCQTLMLTINADGIGQMSCNPAIGGLAKGHLVREIDALGGEMGKATDLTGLQFRMLNTKKGPAVWAPRAQCDKKAYQFRMKWVCEREPNLDIKQAQVTRIIRRDQMASGVETTLDVQYNAKVIVVTTGTFLRGLMHIGSNQQSGGRAGESSAVGLSGSLKDIGIELSRLKTGTPPRLLRRSIDFSKTSIQPGDDPVPYFSFWKEDVWNPERSGINPNLVARSEGRYPPGSILDQNNGQLPCYLTYTTERTADVIRANLSRSPMYSGTIEGVGPRYCPSIEDKIVKFADRECHQIFLEPEGITTDEIYLNGCSTCLPYEVQVDLVRTIIGCENSEILRPAYAVEYDFAQPTQLTPWLETKECKNLFLAGQINGTSGYEEAGAQGIVAGINAALRIHGKVPIVIGRDEAYIGVLIDDLVTKGTTEPYRMFTSRSEFRLVLRQDNADMRLSEIGWSIGLLKKKNYDEFKAKESAVNSEILRMKATRSGETTLIQLLRRPEIKYSDLPDSGGVKLPEDVVRQVEIAVKYEGYIARQEGEIARFRSMDHKRIPTWVDFSRITGLRMEARQKLSSLRPGTIGQASRISGVTPADIGIILVHLKSATGGQPDH